jgi:hypothetical protein
MGLYGHPVTQALLIVEKKSLIFPIFLLKLILRFSNKATRAQQLNLEVCQEIWKIL